MRALLLRIKRSKPGFEEQQLRLRRAPPVRLLRSRAVAEPRDLEQAAADGQRLLQSAWLAPECISGVNLKAASQNIAPRHGASGGARGSWVNTSAVAASQPHRDIARQFSACLHDKHFLEVVDVEHASGPGARDLPGFREPAAKRTHTQVKGAYRAGTRSKANTHMSSSAPIPYTLPFGSIMGGFPSSMSAPEMEHTSFDFVT